MCVCVRVLQTQSCLAVFQFTVGRFDFDTVYAEPEFAIRCFAAHCSAAPPID